MSGWTKLFSTIVGSSVWMEDDKTLRVWIGFLALSDKDGVVLGTPRRMAEILKVDFEEFEVAIQKFTSEDPESSSPEYGGRRVEKVPGGWRLLNYAKYREAAQAGEGSRAPYYRKWRARKKAEAKTEVGLCGVPECPAKLLEIVDGIGVCADHAGVSDVE